MTSRTSWPYALVLGLAAGALLAALAIPGRQPTVGTVNAADPSGTTSGGFASGTTVGDQTANSAAPGTPSGGPDAAGVDGGGRAAGRLESNTATTGGDGEYAPDRTVPAGDGEAGRSASDVVGVTDDVIRIGVGLPDLGAVEALGPNYDDGDVREQMDAVLAGWHESGALPVNGRDVEFAYRSYDITTTEDQFAACVGWAEDDKVFAVIAVNNYWAAGECVARERKIPLVVTDIYYQDVIDRSFPYLFTIPYGLDQMLVNWADFLVDQHLADDDSVIGLYYGTGYGGAPVVEGAFMDEMERLGLADNIAVRVTTDNYATGAPEDNVAAQRFAAAKVDVALLLVSAINQTNFQQTATALAYHPTYVGSDFLFTTNDTAASTFSANQYDGSPGMTTYRFGEESAGMGRTPEATACADNYEAHSGNRVEYQRRPAEWMALQQGCDVASLLLSALQSAGRDLTRPGVVAALENLPPRRTGLHADVDFSPGDRTGTVNQRIVRWHQDCTCWKAEGPWVGLIP